MRSISCNWATFCCIQLLGLVLSIKTKLLRGYCLGVHYILGTPPSYLGPKPNYIAKGSQNNIWGGGLFVAFSSIFVNTNSTKGPFVAPSGISVNTNLIKGPKEFSSPTSPIKGRDGEVERDLFTGSQVQLSHFLLPFAPFFVG